MSRRTGCDVTHARSGWHGGGEWKGLAREAALLASQSTHLHIHSLVTLVSPRHPDLLREKAGPARRDGCWRTAPRSGREHSLPAATWPEGVAPCQPRRPGPHCPACHLFGILPCCRQPERLSYLSRRRPASLFSCCPSSATTLIIISSSIVRSLIDFSVFTFAPLSFGACCTPTDLYSSRPLEPIWAPNSKTTQPHRPTRSDQTTTTHTTPVQHTTTATDPSKENRGQTNRQTQWPTLGGSCACWCRSC